MIARAAIVMTCLAACVDSAPAGDRVCSREEQRTIPLYQDRAIDLLFVVDRTPSMADEHATLLANAPVFANVLQQLEGGLPDLHMAVVTSDLGGQGVSGCSAGDGGRFLGGERCGLTGSFLAARSGDAGLADAFTCLLDLPLSTCPVSQPIAAAVRALGGSEPTNDGFRREGAYLAIVIITDGDDCSLIDRVALSGLTDEAGVDIRCASLGEPALASIGDSIDWLSADDPREPFVSLIANAPSRLSTLADEVRERFTPVDITGSNWADAFVQLSGWGPMIGNPCFHPAIDLEPTVPGIQPECVGSLRTTSGSMRLPWCSDPGASPPCMRAYEDPQSCPDLVAVNVNLGGERIIGGAYAELRCALPCE